MTTDSTPTQRRQTHEARVDTLLEVRVTLEDAKVIVTEECIDVKGKELIKLNGVVLGLDTAIAYVDLALEAITHE